MSNYEKITTGMGEECGVFGAYDMDGGDVAPSVYYGLYEQQIYVAICIVAILLDFYIHMVLVNKINNRCDSKQAKSKKTTNLKDQRWTQPFLLYRLVNYKRSQNQ